MDDSLSIVPNTGIGPQGTPGEPPKSSQRSPQKSPKGSSESSDTNVKQDQAAVAEEVPKDAPPKKQKTPKDLERALVKLGKYVKSYHKNLKFYVDETDGEFFVFLFDTEKDVLIKKMTQKEAFEIVERLDKDGKTNLVNREI
jgi:uncharacterized FlaG/YvyC family protein